MDHRLVTVGLCDSWWGASRGRELQGDDVDNSRHDRLGLAEWGEEEWSKYRKIAGRVLGEQFQDLPQVNVHEQVMFAAELPKWFKHAGTGERWRYTTKDVQVVWKWNEELRRAGMDRAIQAILVESTAAQGGEVLDVSTQ